ncbi:M15 family metallopeptidase [Candidatus Microgenomates bacterium]|nr:M15 family metallopeptidase [Candidatus Microgenomates bacterium]
MKFFWGNLKILVLAIGLFSLGLVLWPRPKIPPADEVGDWGQSENVLGESSARSCPGISFLDVLLDKNTAVPADYVPLDLVTIESQKLRSEVANQYRLMKADAQKAGYTFTIYSGFRTFEQQTALHQQNPKSAPPGHSEHQLGTAIDLLYSPNTWNWLDQNAHKYGFVMSYRGTQQDQTGYEFEPWHWRFVGIALATKIRLSADLPQTFYRKIKCG